MAKKLILLLIIIIGINCQQQKIPPAPSNATNIETSGEKINISILPVTDETEEANDLQIYLQRYHYIRFIERQNIQNIMDELAFSMTGAIAEKEIVEIGKLSSVQKFVFLERKNQNYFAKLVDTETGKTDAVYKNQSINALAKSLAYKLQDEISLKMLSQIQHENPDINLILKTDKTNYNVGESVTFEFQSNVNCYITILDIQPPNNEIVVLFPNKFKPDNFIEAGKKYTIPSKNDRFKIITTNSGLETVKIIATLDDIDILNQKFLTNDSFASVKSDKKRELVRSLAITSVGIPDHRWATHTIQFEIKND